MAKCFSADSSDIDGNLQLLTDSGSDSGRYYE